MMVKINSLIQRIKSKVKIKILACCNCIVEKLNGKERSIEDEVNELNEKIFCEWKECWKINCSYGNNTEAFEKIVEINYEFFQMKAKKNARNNFNYKENVIKRIRKTATIAMVILFIYYLFYLLMSSVSGSFEISMPIVKQIKVVCPVTNNFTEFMTIVMVIVILFLIRMYAEIKNIGVRKYQETWARHQKAFHGLQMEMIKYRHALLPYNNSDVKLNNTEFMLHILDILNDNNQKFVDNMENKEEKISDLVEKVLLGASKYSE